MIHALDPLRDLTIASILLRFALAIITAGLLGLERARKNLPAGFRTYMLVCLGASLCVMLSQYLFIELSTRWSAISKAIGTKTDVSRFGAQVINGIGFLGAGTVIVTGRQEVKGLTTAAGLWASACMGLAIGACYYEVVGVCFLIIFCTMRFLAPFEATLGEHSRNMNIYTEFSSIRDVAQITSFLKYRGIRIYDVEISHESAEGMTYPNAIFWLRLPKSEPHVKLISALSELSCMRTVDEI